MHQITSTAFARRPTSSMTVSTTSAKHPAFLPQPFGFNKNGLQPRQITTTPVYGRPRTPLPAPLRKARAPLIVCVQGMRGVIPSQRVQVQIEAPANNRRIIRAVNLINAPIATVWQLLTDYSRLADHIPNLVVSRVRRHPTGGIRLEQCGAQKIFGFEFRASLTMDMKEVTATSPDSRAINFDLVSSTDFREFRGAWQLCSKGPSKTVLYYVVSVIPKGIIPVRAIEWRISEDVPENMDAVRTECERRRRNQTASSLHARRVSNESVREK